MLSREVDGAPIVQCRLVRSTIHIRGRSLYGELRLAGTISSLQLPFTPLYVSHAPGLSPHRLRRVVDRAFARTVSTLGGYFPSVRSTCRKYTCSSRRRAGFLTPRITARPRGGYPYCMKNGALPHDGRFLSWPFYLAHPQEIVGSTCARLRATECRSTCTQYMKKRLSILCHRPVPPRVVIQMQKVPLPFGYIPGSDSAATTTLGLATTGVCGQTSGKPPCVGDANHPSRPRRVG